MKDSKSSMVLRQSYEEIRKELSNLKVKWRMLEENKPWRWMGDGSDNLDSMSDGMSILITAGDLKKLLEQEYDEGRSRPSLGDRLFEQPEVSPEQRAHRNAAILEALRNGRGGN